ncbi:lipase family protein [Gordonia sp. SL306]|uniref:lipase family protein n=1 Tax=Gordonia sp. SL306 TaxID=2995145 RepID=UPI002271B45A|nr:lipase family protein [Gordonia sp. SL306]WAC56255.1 lipase [Gordonia sp. SL306]
MRFVRLLVASVATVAFALVPTLTTAPANSAPYWPASAGDSSYATPAGLAGARPGQVLKYRPMPSPFPGSTAAKVMFRSTNSQGRPIAGVTTVFTPVGGARHSLLSYQPFTNALGLQCAPSRQLFAGGLQENPLIQTMLAGGHAVNVPDHLGPTSAYGAARLGGVLTLDSIRAAQDEPRLRVGRGVRTALAGYSGGAMASAFAAVLAPRFGRGLNLVGLSAGGTPMNIESIARSLGGTPNPLFGLGFAAAMGLEREYPQQLPLSTQLNAQGRGLAARIRNACTQQIIDAGANKRVADVVPGGQFAETRAGLGALRQNSVQDYPGAPPMPVLLYQGSGDQLTPTSTVEAVAATWRRRGTPVQTVAIPGDHGSTIVTGIPIAIGFLNARLG